VGKGKCPFFFPGQNVKAEGGRSLEGKEKLRTKNRSEWFTCTAAATPDGLSAWKKV